MNKEKMCPHARPLTQMCPHCLGINNMNNETKQEKLKDFRQITDDKEIQELIDDGILKKPNKKNLVDYSTKQENCLEWNLSLYKDSGKITQQEADDFVDEVIELAEKRKYMCIGGYHLEEETKQEKLREEIEMRLTYALTSGENLEYAINSIEILINELLQKEKKEPMGVSQWKEYGKKYGYFDFFKKKIIDEVVRMVEEKKDKRFEETQNSRSEDYDDMRHVEDMCEQDKGFFEATNIIIKELKQ